MHHYRDLFEGMEPLENGEQTSLIHLDNAATTPAFKVIVEDINRWVKYYGAIGRGIGEKSEWSTNAYEEARKEILHFFNVLKNPNYQVVYTKNTTEGINHLAQMLVTKEDQVLVSRMEHHANDLAWRGRCEVVYVETDDKGRISIEGIENQLRAHNGKIKYVSLSGASNVTGYMNPIHEIAQIVHENGAKLIIDGAQLVAHKKINLLGNKPGEEIDFIVFSGHKAYAPFGSGAIVGNFADFPEGRPNILGGGMVEEVADDYYILSDVPTLLEGGTPNLIGILAMTKALKVLDKIGFEAIEAHEEELKQYLMDGLKKIPGIIIYGDDEAIKDRLGVITFNIAGKSHVEVAERLADEYHIATRYGKFCAYPYVDRLIDLEGQERLKSYYGCYGMIRLSLGLHNTKEDIDWCLAAIYEVATKQ